MAIHAKRHLVGAVCKALAADRAPNTGSRSAEATCGFTREPPPYPRRKTDVELGSFPFRWADVHRVLTPPAEPRWDQPRPP